MTQDQEFLKRLRQAFKIEAEEHLTALASGLVQLEKVTDPAQQQELIETIFRGAHSMKGASRAVSMRDIEMICAALETVFARWKRKELRPEPSQFDILQKAVDIVSDLLDNPEAAPSVPVPELIKQISRIEQGQPVEKTTPPKAIPPSPVKPNRILIQPTPESPRLEAAVLAQAASTLTAAPLTIQPQQIMQPEPAPLPAAPETAPPASTDDSPVKDKETARAEKKMPPQSTETIRIATAKLDSLMRQSEEMLAIKQALRERISVLAKSTGLLDIWRKEWKKLQPEMRNTPRVIDKKNKSSQADPHINRITGFLDWNQAQIMALEQMLTGLLSASEQDLRSLGGMVDNLLDDMKKALMMPFSSLLQIFPKMVRDLSRERGKQVELVMHGSEIEIDKRILEELKDPFIHLVRNCIDHGLETPLIRTKHGKPAQGTLTVTISQIGGSQIEIVVSDDGAGINLARLKQKAIEERLLLEKEADNLTEAETMALIWESGISTSPIITDLSGRGLGMAIVREKIEKLGGSVTVETKANKGAAFRMLLPITLATFRGILVRVGDHVFVVPTANVDLVRRIPLTQIKTVENKSTVPIKGRPVSLVALSDVLGLLPTALVKDQTQILVLLLSASDKQIAFRVDEVLDEQEVLIKALGKQLSRVRNISGVTILGSGKIVPILNILDVIKSAITTTGLGTGVGITPEKSTPANMRKAVLVADDSITSRMLVKGILQAAGYNVQVAVDGAEALRMLKSEPFDLLVSDVEMPRMNGFDLTVALRNDKNLSELPIVLVTSLASREDQERGIEVGANAYIIKSSFDQTKLLQVIERLV